jgi:hypothetical protein
MAKTKNNQASLDEEKVEETELDTPSKEDEQEKVEDTGFDTPEEEEAEPKSPEEIAPKPASSTDIPLGTHAPMGSKARAMKEKLAKQPKVRVFIPLAAGEKQGVTQSVVLNGYPMYIRKGSYVDVPQSVAEVLEVKLKHKMTVENHPSRITGEGDVPMTRYGN